MAGGAMRELFIEGEKVLCYHGDLLYEAKCLGSKIRHGELVYRIHYIGWSKNWDTWAKNSQIRKSTDANLQLKDELMAKHNIHALGRDRKSKFVKKRKRKLDPTRSDQYSDAEPDKILESIPSDPYYLPSSLMDLLLRDQYMVMDAQMTALINHEMSLFDLELHSGVDLESSEQQLDYEESQNTEFKLGMLSYFDALMPIYLLYATELHDTPSKPPHEYCTIVHLLRFLVKLPEFLSPLLADDDTEKILMPFIKKFLTWLGSKVTELKLMDYWDEFYLGEPI